MREGPHERFAGSFHEALVRKDVEIGNAVGTPFVGGLTVERAAAFESDVVEIFAGDERRFRRGIKLRAVEGGKQRGARFDIKPHTGAQVELAGGVFTGTDVDGATPGFAACVNGLLEGGTGVVGFDSGGAVVFYVEDRLSAYETCADGEQR